MSFWTRLLTRLRREVAFAHGLAADPRVPRLARWLLLAAVLYALSPIDLIPDFIPVLGLLDDLVIVPLLLWLALRQIPPAVVAEHRAALVAGGGEATPGDVPRP